MSYYWKLCNNPFSLEFSSYQPHETYDARAMDELFPWLKSLEEGVEEESVNLATATPGEFVPTFSLFAFLVVIICNEGIA